MVSYEPCPVVEVSKFREELAFEFPDLPNEMLDYYVVRTARDMATRGPILRRGLTFPLDPCVTRYYIDAPDGMEVDSLLDVRHLPDGDPEHGSLRIPRFRSPVPGQPWHHEKGCWYEPDTHVLVVHLPPCECPGKIHCVMSVLPARDACELPSIFLDRLLPALMMGVRSQILLLSGKPWTDLSTGASFQAEYLKLIGHEVTRQHLHGQTGMVKMHHGPAL